MNQFVRNIVLILATICLVVACKKDDLPPGVVGTPVFISSFTFDGTPYEMSAGNNGQALSTSTIIEGDTAYFYTALDAENCETCGPALYLNLIGQDLESNWGNADFQNTLLSWNYAFATATEFDTTLTIRTTSSGSPGIWSLNGIPQNSQLESSFQFEIENFGSYDIKLDSENPACGQIATRMFQFNGALPCYANLYRESGNNFNIQTKGGFNQANKTYSWSYNDTTATTTVPFYYAASLGQASYMLVGIHELGGCTDSVRMNLAITPTSCVTNFTIDTMLVNYVVNGTQAALMELTFIDVNDVEYSSSNQIADQPSFTNIQLLEATPYTEPTEPNRAFIKVKFEIAGMLYDSQGNGKIFNGIVETAFEDPEL